MRDQATDRGTYATADELIWDLHGQGMLLVNVVRGSDGAYSVVMELDGGYSLLEDAQEVAESFTRDIAYLTNSIDESDGAA